MTKDTSSRATSSAVPVRVDYRFTSLGQSLLPVVRAVKDWAEEHMAEVLAARDRYDAQ